MKQQTEDQGTFHKNVVNSILFIACSILMNETVFAQKLKLSEQEYYEAPGINVLVYSNQYNGMFFDEKTAGIELIHHGVRTATGGAIRLQNTPEQWDLVPEVVDRKVNRLKNETEVTLRYKEYDFSSRIIVIPKDKGVSISVYLDQPLPDKLAGSAGFNLEFIPSAYFGKTYLMDGSPRIFPLYPSGTTAMQPLSQKIPQFAGHSTFDDRGKNEFIVPAPLSRGKTIILAPEDPERYVKIRSEDADLMLFDGRNLAQNGWFIVRSLLPAGKTGKVMEWYLEPNTVPDWKRQPVIGFSQIGYHPGQKKVAVIELDQNDPPANTATVFEILPDGQSVQRWVTDLRQWGKYLRYNYLTFDFSTIDKEGLYYIQYGTQKTNPFPISKTIYHDIWHPTLDVWFPVQMDHMMVNEGYRVWHGAPFLDDALQAPVNHEHFDGYSMGATTDTKYKPLERIPGLGVGGWFDAGDFDIQTGSHCDAILSLVAAREQFGIDRDETFIDQETRYVDIHRPDGKPDILQQIEHGTLNLVAQVKNIGHPVRGIVVPKLHQYHHLGDAINETDNLPYNPGLKPYQSDGKSSGTLDDRWAFTTRMPSLDYYTAAALSAAYRALKNYNDSLATESLKLAQQLWREAGQLQKGADTSRFAWYGKTMELTAALQLYISTKDQQYARRFKELVWPILGRSDRQMQSVISVALQACPYMDKQYREQLRPYVQRYKQYSDELGKDNPYAVPVTKGGWGGNGVVVDWAITNYYAYKSFPDIIDKAYVYKGLNYLLGCHPYSNISFVSSVGVHSKKITYGNNRADFSFIAGGVVPGIMVLKPDFPENKEDWPFFWGENEVVVGICAAYIFLANSADEISTK